MKVEPLDAAIYKIERAISFWNGTGNKSDINAKDFSLSQLRTIHVALENLKGNETLLEKYHGLVQWYDKQHGTPCEQIRHQQVAEQLTADARKLRDAVCSFLNDERYGLGLTGMGENHLRAITEAIREHDAKYGGTE